jgi:hypothetical protein
VESKNGWTTQMTQRRFGRRAFPRSGLHCRSDEFSAGGQKCGSVVRIWNARVNKKSGGVVPRSRRSIEPNEDVNRVSAVWACSTGVSRKDSVREDIWCRGARCSLAAYPRWGTQVTDHIDSHGSGEKGNVCPYLRTR